MGISTQELAAETNRGVLADHIGRGEQDVRRDISRRLRDGQEPGRTPSFLRSILEGNALVRRDAAERKAKSHRGREQRPVGVLEPALETAGKTSKG